MSEDVLATSLKQTPIVQNLTNLGKSNLGNKGCKGTYVKIVD